MFDDSNLPAEQFFKNIGLCTITLPILTSLFVTQKSLFVAGIYISPIVGSIEYVVTGKYDETIKVVNTIGNLDNIIIDIFFEEKDQEEYRNIFE